MVHTPVALAALLLTVGSLATPSGTLAQSTTPRPTHTGANTGEKMMAVINVIKADKRDQLRELVRKFDAAAAKVSTTDAAIRSMVTQTRLLKPLKANEDGTFYSAKSTGGNGIKFWRRCGAATASDSRTRAYPVVSADPHMLR